MERALLIISLLHSTFAHKGTALCIDEGGKNNDSVNFYKPLMELKNKMENEQKMKLKFKGSRLLRV